MKKFRFKSRIGLGFLLLFIVNIGLVIFAIAISNHLLIGCGILLSCFQFYLHSRFSQKSRILKNYPYRAILENVLTFLPIRLSGLFFKKDALKDLLNQKQQEVLIKRSKNILTAVVQDNLLNKYDPGFEYLQTNNAFLYPSSAELRVDVGTEQCRQPYSLSILNFGSPDSKSLNKKCVHAISQAANMLSCAVNTGEEALSPELIRGGCDLIWQIRYDDCSLRNEDRSLNETLIKTMALKPYIKMIEIKFQSNNAPLAKKGLTAFAIFSFVKTLRMLSKGKPVGIYMLNPGKEIINLWGKAMASSGVYLDFITIENSNVQKSLFQNADLYQQRFFKAILTAKHIVNQYHLRTKIIATGVFVTEYDILRAAALGADACVNVGNTLLATGTIRDYLGISPCSQSIRIANFHRNTIDATGTLMRICRYEKLSEADPADFFRRVNGFETKSLKDIVGETDVVTPYPQYVNLN